MNQAVIVQEKMNQKPHSCTVAFSSANQLGSTRSRVSTGLGVVLFNEGTHQLTVYYKGLAYSGEKESDEIPAFKALIIGMEQAKDKGYKNVQAVGNSIDLQNKYGRPWKIADEDVRQLCLDAMKIQKSFDSFTLFVVPQEDNNLAHKYASVGAALSVDDPLQEKAL